MRYKREGKMNLVSNELEILVLGTQLLIWLRTLEIWMGSSVTRLGDLFDFGQLFKAFGNN